MDRIIEFYKYCDIQPPASKTYLPLLNPSGINIILNTHILENIYREKIRDPFIGGKKWKAKTNIKKN